MFGTKRMGHPGKHSLLGRLGLVSAALGAAATLLAACTGDTGSPQSRPCPQVRVVQDASYLTRFNGGTEDLTNTSFEARIARSKSLCYYEENTSSGATTVRSEIQLEFAASRGPSNPDSAARFRYQVGVTGPGGKLMPGKQVLDVEIPFTASRVQGSSQDEIVVFTPLQSGENGDFYRIWVTLEVTPQELDYNRRNPMQ